ncbi:hypothetical protein [Paracoccus tibetensis]|uniref:LysM domain-containing protein n=1 Tax=Paracoccus tibetensis TaxID=336292 RepID=A0A1G5JZE5_9RHOB|nr:hypothetical protein [Paracoccus tibetensis]SCY93301.1 hypothetical protein SAMN05660710_03537 [Paracoccus tibetensis]
MKTITVSASLLILGVGAASAQSCPAAVPFGSQDRLDELAARCNVTPEAILRANDVGAEADLGTAGAVAIPRPRADDADGLLDRAGDVLEDTAEQADALATEAGSRASDFVADTDLGGALSPGPQISMARLPTGSFRIEAGGLPPASEVRLALWQGETLLADATRAADAEGEVAVDLAAAGHVASGPQVRAELTADGDLHLRASID